MPSGTVKFFDAQKGFGFIIPDEPGRDLFVHARDLEGSEDIVPNDRVSFEVGEGRKGPKAPLPQN